MKGVSPTKQLKAIAFRMRDVSPVTFWMNQSLRELGEWLDIIEEEKKA